MFSFKCFKNFVYSSFNLPLTLSFLEEWCLVYVDGIDSKKYLQNQLTIDMNLLNKNEYKFCAHCNFNGKVWATMFIFHYKNGYAYIVRNNVAKIQIKELKKYAVFHKVKIQRLQDVYLFGLSGFNAKFFLLKNILDISENTSLLISNKQLISNKKKIILCFLKPIERFLLVLSSTDLLFLQKKNEIKIFNNSQQWLLFDIEAGFPTIEKQTSQKFLPQSINLVKFQAISFNKGCYYGQEIIARVFYKNLNKHALYILSSTGNISPKIGSFIEVKKEEKWYRIGFLLAIVHIDFNKIYIQTVLNKSINIKSIFRIYGFKNIFLIKN